MNKKVKYLHKIMFNKNIHYPSIKTLDGAKLQEIYLDKVKLNEPCLITNNKSIVPKAFKIGDTIFDK